MEFPEYIRTVKMRPLLLLLGVLIIALGIFEAGVAVGFHKAAFSYEWGDHYYRAFGHSRGTRMTGRPGTDDILTDHGAAGTIISMSLPTLVIDDTNHVERVVRMGNDTMIRRFRDTLSANDLKERDYIVVLGTPNSRSEIEARFIRVLTTPPGKESATTTLPR